MNIQRDRKIETNQEHFSNHPQEKGSALVYVLVAIALFAALSFTLGRQTDTSETASLPEERAEIHATQIISTASQVKSVIDQMLFTGTDVAALNFERPADETGTLFEKVYHSQGGGLNHPTLPVEAIEESGSDPDPGWYLGRFNNVDWSSGAGDDVILVAYQITEQICGLINRKIRGTTDIPTMTDTIANLMIDEAAHAGTNVDLTTGTGNICVECENMASLCVEDSNGDFGFYTIVAEQ